MDKTNFQKRQVAFKTSIRDFLSGVYVKEDGFIPNYVLIRGLKVSRANILGCVVSKVDAEIPSLIIDDGSGQISVRSYDNNFSYEAIGVGDFVQIIGRLREFNNEKFVNPEIVTKLEDPKWFEVRKKELNLPSAENLSKNEQIADNVRIIEEEVEEIVIETASSAKSDKGRVLDLIRANDKGNGVDFEYLIKASNIQNCEEVVEQLLKDGEIFEISSGRLKVLE